MLLPNDFPAVHNLIDYRQAARLADLRETDLLRMVREGLFPEFIHVEINGVTYPLFRRTSVEKWIEAGRPRVSAGRAADFVANVPEGWE